MMGHLEEQPNMNVFQNQQQVILFPEAFIMSIIECIILFNTYLLQSLSLFSFRKGCNTNGGSHPNVPCVFPFIYKGTTYTGCTDVDNGGVPWCATTTLGVNAPYFGCLPIYVPTYTGNCEPSCPGV